MHDTKTDSEILEVLSLLRDRDMERLRRPGKLKDVAAKQLFEQLASLNGRYELSVREQHGEWYELQVALQGASVEVTYYSEEGITVGGEDTEATEVPLDYDRERKTFIGRELDGFRTPVPGEPIPRRPAIAVLVAAIIDTANTSKKR